MKRKRILALLLALVLCLSLAACTGKTDNNNSGGNSGSKDNGGSSSGKTDSGSSATPAPDTYIYIPEYIPLTGELTNYVNQLYAAGDRFLISSYGIIGNNAPEGTPEEEKGMYDQYGTIFYWLGLDGTTAKLANYQPMEAPMESTEDGKVQCSAYNQNFSVAADGSILSLDCVYINMYTGPDEPEMYSEEWWNLGYYEQYMTNEQHYYVRTLGQDGSELSRISLDAAAEAAEAAGSYFSAYKIIMDKEGNIILNSDSALYKLDKTGAMLATKSFEEKMNDPDGYFWLNDMFLLGDKILITYYGNDGQMMTSLDSATLTPDFENAHSVNNMYNAIPGTGDYDLYYTNGSNLMGYKLSSGESEKVLNWINSDVNPNNTGSACMLSDGRIALVESEWDSNYENATSTLILLSKVPASSVAQKTVLTFATQYLDYDMQESIVKFNRTSPDYRIEVLDYSEYNTEEDYSAGLTKLTTEIMAGNVPDIIDLNGLPYSKIASKGLLEDLTPYLAADSELNGKLLPNVVEALSVGGKLYRTASSFNVITAVGAASIVGDTPGWTLKDLKTALSYMPEGCTPFDETTTQSEVLNYALCMELDKLVDWDTGKCSFDTGLFAEALEFSAMFPKEYDWNNYSYDDSSSEYARIANGQQMLLLQWFYDFDTIQYINAIFGGNATYIGFPTSDGVGSAMNFNENGYAISAKCSNKDIAWQFVRTMFTKDYQLSKTWSFPTNSDALAERVKEATTPYYETDWEGNFVLDENGNKIEQSRGTWGWGGYEVEIYALTEEEAAEVVDMLTSVDKVYNYDEELMNLITADCEAFFAGQKSADEVGKLLQSKMTIYVGEQK